MKFSVALPPIVTAKSGCAPMPRSGLRRVTRFLSWMVPGTIIALMPKCPVCLAAYLTLGTGIGLSLPAVENIRTGALALSAVSLGVLAVRFCAARAQRNRVVAAPPDQTGNTTCQSSIHQTEQTRRPIK